MLLSMMAKETLVSITQRQPSHRCWQMLIVIEGAVFCEALYGAISGNP